jgi:hypothetical protein
VTPESLIRFRSQQAHDTPGVEGLLDGDELQAVEHGSHQISACVSSSTCNR